MQIAILAFDGFNEIDSFVAGNMLNRLRDRGWKAFITAPAEKVVSRNGVVVETQRPLEFAAQADAVLVGSHGHSGVSDLIHGTIISNLRHHIKASVIIVPIKE